FIQAVVGIRDRTVTRVHTCALPILFYIIRSLSENVIVPIAGVIITFVMCYELIQLVIEKNNLHDLRTWIFFKWIFKTFVAVLLVTNTWNIVMGVFDITQSEIGRASCRERE